METQDFKHGFRVVGALSAPRKLVTWRKAFAAHCAGELDTGEAYLSAWCYPQDLLAHMKNVGGVAGYTGPCWADWVPLDIDGAGEDPVADALSRTCSLLTWVHSKGAHLNKLSCWFSGCKGFHVLLPNIGLALAPEPDFRQTARAFVARIGQESGCNPDLSIYDAVRLFRSPNSRHPKTGLYKVAFRADELLGMSTEAVRGMAVEPRPGDVPEPGSWCDWSIGGLWADAEKETASTTPVDPATRIDLNRLTLEFIGSGAPNGEREHRCFSAAANLAEFGADERLAKALLLKAAVDSGLSPSEAQRAIQCGVRHVKGGAS